MALLANAQQTVTAAPGTGSVSFGAAAPGAQTWAAAGASAGGFYSYRIEGAAGWEIGVGFYSAGSPAGLSRSLILASSNGNAAVSFGADAVVSQVALPGDIGAPSFRNRIVNGNLAINLRQTSPAATSYAAGAFVFDRWRAGANGCTCSWSASANGDVTVTITAGTLYQTIEGPLYLPEGGTYILSWQGTAAARIYQGSSPGAFAASPIAAGLTVGTKATVEVSTGTFALAQLEPGASATSFERRDDEERRCMRYAQFVGAWNGGWQTSSTVFICAGVFPVPMLAAPTLTFVKGIVHNYGVSFVQISSMQGSSVSRLGGYIGFNTGSGAGGGSIGNLQGPGSDTIIYASAEP